MSRDETLTFLATGARTATVATVATTSADGSPHAVPVWFVVDGDTVVFTSAAGSARVRNLARDPRIAIAVDDEAFPYAFATVWGRARLVERPDDLLAWTTRIAARYVGEERAEEIGRSNAEIDDCLVRVPVERLAAIAELAS